MPLLFTLLLVIVFDIKSLLNVDQVDIEIEQQHLNLGLKSCASAGLGHRSMARCKIAGQLCQLLIV